MSENPKYGWRPRYSPVGRISTPQSNNFRHRRPLQFESLEDRLAPAVLTVNSLADGPVNLADSVVTLRDAIHAANENLQVAPGGPTGSGTDEIRFQPGLNGTITLTQGHLALRSDLSITGPGTDVINVSGNNAFRVFDVNEGDEGLQKTVSLSGLTISNGSYASYHGGGITNREKLTITDCTIRNNFTGTSGGAIYNFPSGHLTVGRSTISGNVANGDGGGIANHGFLLVEQNSSISGNSAKGAGGGIFNHNELRLNNCTVSANVAASGGGIHHAAAFRDDFFNYLFVQHSTISGNNSAGDGGGFFISDHTGFTVEFSTISGNSAGGSGGGISNNAYIFLYNSTISGNLSKVSGGGIASGELAIARLANCTITLNRANSGSGIYFFQPAGVRLANTIVSQNFLIPITNIASDIFGFNGRKVNGFSSNNIIGSGGSAGLVHGERGNQVGIDNIGLAPLADNGGPTLTHALLALSPAINAGNNTEVKSQKDQRGKPRISYETVDIGAYELQPVNLIVDTDTDEDDGNYNPGDLSLREAINLAYALAGPDVITFSTSFFNTPRTITLTQGAIEIRSDLTVTGPGANLLTVSGNNTTRVLYVTDFTPTVRTVTISGLTISGGNSSSFAGGGIINSENLTISSGTIRNNAAGSGGGGVLSTGVLALVDSTVSGNTAAAGGGGILNYGTLTVHNSTISSNNSAAGGGIYSKGALLMTNGTIADNRASNQLGGGGLSLSSVATTTLHNSIVADNFSRLLSFPLRDDIGGAGGVAVSGTYNLISSSSASGLTNGVNGNLVGVDNPLLGPLASNGGSTWTHALLEGSVAINAGDPAFVVPPNYDQRGAPYARVASGRVDMGAFESQSIAPASADFDGDHDVDGRDFLLWQRGFGKSNAVHSDGDADNDADVDAVDLGYWAQQYGEPVSPVVELAAPVTAQVISGKPSMESLLTNVTLLDLALEEGVPLTRIDNKHELILQEHQVPELAWSDSGFRFSVTSPKTPLDEKVESVQTCHTVDGNGSPWMGDDLLEKIFG